MTVENLAKCHRDRSIALLGHRPGPGYDIVITPTRPVSASWNLEGRTQAGKAYLIRVRHGNRLAIDNRDLQQIKANLQEWGLSFHTDWSCVKVVRTDP